MSKIRWFLHRKRQQILGVNQISWINFFMRTKKRNQLEYFFGLTSQEISDHLFLTSIQLEWFLSFQVIKFFSSISFMSAKCRRSRGSFAPRLSGFPIRQIDVWVRSFMFDTRHRYLPRTSARHERANISTCCFGFSRSSRSERAHARFLFRRLKFLRRNQLKVPLCASGKKSAHHLCESEKKTKAGRPLFTPQVMILAPKR